MRKRIMSISLICASILFSACTGGGSNNSASGNTDNKIPKAIDVSINGTAVDELILNGKVKVSKADGTLLSQGRTSGSDGTYSLKVTGYNGAVIINVTCDTNSKILVNDKNETCPTNLNLNSLTNASSKEITVHISPLTQIVYKRAKALAQKSGKDISKDDIKNAISVVSNLFGVNPLENDPTKSTYKAIIEKFHLVAKNNPNKTLFDVINDFATDMEDGNIDNSQELILALKSDTTISNDLTKNLDANGHYLIPTDSKILTIKDTITEIRTQAVTVLEYGQNEADNISNILDNSTINIQNASEYVAKIVRLISDTKKALKIENIGIIGQISVTVKKSSLTSNVWNYTFTDKGVTYNGTVDTPKSSDLAQKNFDNITSSFKGTIPNYYNNPQENSNTSQNKTLSTTIQNVSLNISFKKTTEGSDIELTNLSINSTDYEAKIKSLKASVAYKSNGDITKVILNNGDVEIKAKEYMVTGMLSLTDYIQNNSLKNEANNNEGYFPSKITFTGAIKNTKTLSEINATVKISSTNLASINFNQDITNDILRKETLKNISLKVDIGGNLKMPNRPLTKINLGYETTTNSSINSFTSSYHHGTTLITVSADIDGVNQNAKIVITNQNGINLTIIIDKNGNVVNGNIANSTGSLVKQNNVVIATIELRNDQPIVKYLNGKFESLIF